jgi:hypothetical protein
VQTEDSSDGNKLAWTTPSRVELTTRSTEGGQFRAQIETPPFANFPGCYNSLS